MTLLPLIYDLNRTDLSKKLKDWGEPGYRANQIWEGIYVNLWAVPDDFSNLPKKLREKLGANFSFQSLSKAVSLDSKDGETTKSLFHIDGGHAIEAVLMRYDKRRTLCISTQAGCAMGCVFCATGQMGFKRNLSRGEIVEQVLYYARILKEIDERPSNIVVMGMGEPFHNYDETMAAIDILNDAKGFNMGARRFTVSTVGLIPAINRFADEQRQVNLAISLHATDEAARTAMLPINMKHSIKDLIHACRLYISKTGRRVTFEWALIREVNDSEEQAVELARLLNGLLCHVNVIPLNPTDGYSGKATTRVRARLFRDTLKNNGIPCTIRIRRGIDIHAGCGQLAIREPSLPLS